MENSEDDFSATVDFDDFDDTEAFKYPPAADELIKEIQAAMIDQCNTQWRKRLFSEVAAQQTEADVAGAAADLQFSSRPADSSASGARAHIEPSKEESKALEDLKNLILKNLSQESLQKLATESKQAPVLAIRYEVLKALAERTRNGVDIDVVKIEDKIVDEDEEYWDDEAEEQEKAKSHELTLRLHTSDGEPCTVELARLSSGNQDVMVLFCDSSFMLRVGKKYNVRLEDGGGFMSGNYRVATGIWYPNFDKILAKFVGEGLAKKIAEEGHIYAALFCLCQVLFQQSCVTARTFFPEISSIADEDWAWDDEYVAAEADAEMLEDMGTFEEL